MKKSLFFLFLMTAIGTQTFAQREWQPTIQNLRTPGYQGLNVFEDPKDENPSFDGLKVRVGGDFAIQFQGINHTNAYDDSLKNGANPVLANLGSNFNLPTANLNLDVELHTGVRMHLRTYLSARHHTEAWVKGGHLNIDRLDFVKEGFLSNVMDIVTIRVGLDEINYGDAHFRRSDNARAIYNPFVGNYIMDSFTTEAFGEVYARSNNWIAMFGISNGKLNQNVVVEPEDSEYKPSIYGKLGWDGDVNDDTRIRLTGSIYATGGETRTYLYNGDRAGARYYHVMDYFTSDGNGGSTIKTTDFSGRFNPNFKELTAIQFNPFVKWKGLEFFGIYELAMDGSDNDGSFTQLGAEVLYRFGSWEQLYVAGRYNSVSGKMSDSAEEMNISRMNFGLGWFMTENIQTKLEYVTQSYDGDGFKGSAFEDGNFNGIVVEAVIGF